MDTLTALGARAEIIEVDLSRTAVMRAAAIHYDHVFGASISAEASAHPDKVTEYAKEFARWARRTRGDATFLDGLAIEAELYSSVGSLFDTYDALITPAVATEGFSCRRRLRRTRNQCGWNRIGVLPRGCAGHHLQHPE